VGAQIDLGTSNKYCSRLNYSIQYKHFFSCGPGVSYRPVFKCPSTETSCNTSLCTDRCVSLYYVCLYFGSVGMRDHPRRLETGSMHRITRYAQSPSIPPKHTHTITTVLVRVSTGKSENLYSIQGKHKIPVANCVQCHLQSIASSQQHAFTIYFHFLQF